ncbi:MAG TPA: cobalamin-independent methionine synthase II family protein [Ktedonobacteraceae bacterium]|nr:cobalamin-independent methionine synthase II family protein [Ktedonobacteraceae bacterium]
MKRSIDRILTKPVGSLHRPKSLEAMMTDREQGELVDAATLVSEIQRAVEAVVAMQVQCGMDYVSDGEMSKISFMEYPYRRISGFDGPVNDWIPPDIADFEEAQDFWFDAAAPHVALRQNNGPVQLLDPQAVQQDITHLRNALSAIDGPVEGFLCAASPGSVANPGTSYYHDEALFLGAITDAMRPEYRAIVDAGYILQLDIPDVLMLGAYVLHDRDLYRRLVQPRLEALKGAMKDLPVNRIILHACWGNWPGPHHRDIPLAWIIDLLLDLPAQGLSIEATTQPHQHDWHVFEDPRVAERFHSGEKILFLGLIDTKARALEPAEVIAERLCHFASLIGKENLVASTDCGFGTFLGRSVITPALAEAKLKRLAAGAQLASQMLW